jgi:hypothetical protein
MPIEIRPGLLYFFKGKEDGRVHELAASLKSAGYRLLIISSRSPEKVREELETPAECILTLTESVGQYYVDPQNLMVLTDAVSKFTERGGPSAFLIEDLEVLIQKNEFSPVLHMIGFVCESLALNRAIGVIVIDPETLNKKEMAFLGKEGHMIEEKDRLDMRPFQSHDPKENRPAQNV